MTKHASAVSSARRVIQIDAEAVASLAARVDHRFEMAVDHVLHSRGRVILCGMGKSGIISHKIAATLMSTGTPSFYMQPGAAYHGYLGSVNPADTFVALPHSALRKRTFRYTGDT